MGLPLPSISVGSIWSNMNESAKQSLMQQQLAVVQGMAAEAKVRAHERLIAVKSMHERCFTHAPSLFIQKQMGPAASQALQQLELATDHDAPLQPQGAGAEITEAQKLTGASYQALKAFIDEQDPQKQHYGLVKEVHTGYVEWLAPQNAEAWKRMCDAKEQQAGQVA